jgi:hypothetical protein
MRVRVWRGGAIALAVLMISACGSTNQRADENAVEPPASEEPAFTPSEPPAEGAAEGIAEFETDPGDPAPPEQAGAESPVEQHRPKAPSLEPGRDPGTKLQPGGRQAASAPADPAKGPRNPPEEIAPPHPNPKVPSGPLKADHPGITDTEIRIGILTQQKYDSTTAPFATKGQTLGNQQAQAQAVVNYINNNGGMAKRKLKPVYHDTDSSVGSWHAQAQQVCAAFTEDTKVLAVTPQNYALTTLLSCLAAKDTALLAGGVLGGWADEEMYRQFPKHLYMPSEINHTRLGFWIDGLVRQAFFAKGSKLGILYNDEPRFRRPLERTVKPALKGHGIGITDEMGIHMADSVSDVSATAAATSNSVLRFRSRGIDRIIFVEGVPIIPFFFLNEAEHQGYRPRYGLSSYENGRWLALNAPRTQLVGSLGVGWRPVDDVTAPKDAGANPVRDLCLEIFSKAGVADVTVDSYRESNALMYCANLLFLKTALDAADELNTEGLRRAVEGLGDRWRSPLNFSNRFGPNRHDGAAGARDFAFEESCQCYRYQGHVSATP